MKCVGTPGSANWGTYTPDANGICRDCGRTFGWHAGQGCFSPTSTGMPAPQEALPDQLALFASGSPR